MVMYGYARVSTRDQGLAAQDAEWMAIFAVLMSIVYTLVVRI